jgi:hypothetical protein
LVSSWWSEPFGPVFSLLRPAAALRWINAPKVHRAFQQPAAGPVCQRPAIRRVFLRTLLTRENLGSKVCSLAAAPSTL